ncbi:hypothetical protein WJ41_05030 [Burkholderia ubonensis]|nr:hypothetical protein WJ41_05030 [Burkholderia ubonensis]KVU11038.1 hypothetical protein WK61_01620 [Burkholderia ubonensis]
MGVLHGRDSRPNLQSGSLDATQRDIPQQLEHVAISQRHRLALRALQRAAMRLGFEMRFNRFPIGIC